jgi:7-carboxy-7-deazaguanine synthase
MSLILISAFPSDSREFPEHNNYLEISEFFSDTLQGENFVGWPATFLRLQNCTLNCVYCDTQEVWRQGNPYTFEELFSLMESVNLIKRLKEGQRFIVTGGSPLKQQLGLISFFQQFKEKFGFLPYIEIENECVLKPRMELVEIVSCWNNSPKLASSGNSKVARHKPFVISYMSMLYNSWFKFVIECEEDWQEIQMDFLDTEIIQKRQIVLMPMGETREQLKKTQEICAEMSIKHNVRYSPRVHIDLWDKKTGV